MHGRVLNIALNRPQKRNAMNIEMMHQMVRAFDEADADASVGAIVLSGNGPAFCSGMDLKEVGTADTLRIANLHERLFTLINRVRKPIIAAVQGAALAGGTGLAANSHVLVAAPDAKFGMTELRVGLWPVLVFRAMELALGERRATQLSLTARIFGAREGLEWGLVTEISEAPLARALVIADEIAHFSPVAISAGLDYVHHIRVRNWDEAGRLGHQMRDRLMAGPDFQEGIRAFNEKREPHWPSLQAFENK
jgi:methylglutaconyl-CoA hydratase